MNAAWSEAKRVLAVRLDSAGDVLMTGPALRALQRGAKDREVVLLTSRSGAEAGRLIDGVADVWEYEAPWVKRAKLLDGAASVSVGPDFAAIERLAAAHFDAAVIFTVYSQSALPAAMLCRFAGIPLRLARSRENPYELLTDWERETEPEQDLRHEVERQLTLVRTIGCDDPGDGPLLRISDSARASAIRLLEEAGVGRDRPWAVVHAGATAESRRYPPEAFASAIRLLVADYRWQIVLTGSASEAALVEEIRTLAGVPCASLAGRLSLEELSALIDAAPLLISNNTAPVHVASAVGTPVVDLYALTNPQHTPWGVPSRVLFRDVPCRWCYSSVCRQADHPCLAGVAPEEVVAASLELVEERVGARPQGQPIRT